MTVPCDVDGCPREGTNELPIQSLDLETRELTSAVAHFCDRDFKAAHDAVAAYELALEGER